MDFLNANVVTLSADNWISIGVLIVALMTLLVNYFLTQSQIRTGLKSIKLQNRSAQDIAELEINKDVKSTNRMVWANELRNSVSEYIANHEYIKLISQNDSPQKIGTPTNEWKEGFKKWTALSYKIELLLNPHEEKSRKLKELMTQLNEATDYHSKNKEELYEQYKNSILAVTKEILKEEWERVKKLE